jgi:hypothetical protein
VSLAIRGRTERFDVFALPLAVGSPAQPGIVIDLVIGPEARLD